MFSTRFNSGTRPWHAPSTWRHMALYASSQQLRAVRKKKKTQRFRFETANFNLISTNLLNIQRNDDMLCIICIHNLILGDSWIVFFSNFEIFLFTINKCFHEQNPDFIFNHHRFSQLLFQCSGCMQCRGTDLARVIGENMSSYFVFSPA